MEKRLKNVLPPNCRHNICPEVREEINGATSGQAVVSLQSAFI